MPRFLPYLTTLLLTALAGGQTVSVPLPFDLVDNLDGVKFKIRVPSNWNGTLLLYTQASKSGAPPAEPIIVPPVIDSPQTTLEQTLLSRGYALAASEVSTGGWQVKESVQDTFAVASYFRGRIGVPKRVIAWGSSLGGLTAVQLVENYPRSLDAAIPLGSPLAGWSRRIDRNLDFALAYSVVFGWPDEWGRVGDLRADLNFNRDVYPKFKAPAADGSNTGQWEFIRLVFGLPREALYGTRPLYKVPMFGMIMMTSTQMREDMEKWATGPVAQNTNHAYSLTPEEKTYLRGLGVDADSLLIRMNAARDIQAGTVARGFVERFGEVSGNLSRPVLSVKNTMDGQAEARHESAYRSAVEFWDRGRFLHQTFVSGVGHAAFTSQQLLRVLGAMENWLATGAKPDATSFPAAEGFDNNFAPLKWPY